MLRYVPLVAFILGASFAVESAHACPQSYSSIDNALWLEARNSGDPARWVQYYVSVSTDCPDIAHSNKAAARALLVPLLGDPDKPNSSALDHIQLTGLFSGAQGNPLEKAKNGEVLKSVHQGAELFVFQLYSTTKVDVEIPPILFQGLNPPEPSTTPKNVALWIRYRCKFTNTHQWSGWYDDPPADAGHANCSQGDYTIEAIEVQLMGPYAKFFDEHPNISTRPAGIGGAAELTLSVKLKPQYTSFMGMLTGNFVR
jgi:hypothetical protein